MLERVQLPGGKAFRRMRPFQGKAVTSEPSDHTTNNIFGNRSKGSQRRAAIIAATLAPRALLASCLLNNLCQQPSVVCLPAEKELICSLAICNILSSRLLCLLALLGIFPLVGGG